MRRRQTKEQFIAKAKAVHGDRYDYSLVVYFDARTKVTIICPDDGTFEQRPDSHLSGSGCAQCSFSKKRFTKEKFIERTIAVHGNHYDYSSVNYVNALTKVTIICPNHSAFEQTPADHLSGKGCPDCAGNKPLTKEMFIEKAKAVHGDRYDYSSVEYVNNRIAVTIICPDHNSFSQAPDAHLSGKGCLACGGTKPLTNEVFVKKAKAIHGDRYDYSQVDYVNSGTPVMIICADHGPFPQSLEVHVGQRAGCPECGGSKPLTDETFIEKAKAVHGDRYDYSSVEYINHQTKITIICPDHASFEQTPNAHLAGKGCRDCAQTGFNPSEPGLLYYIAVTTDDGDTRYKIGITNSSVEERFRAPDLSRIRIVKTWRYAVGHAAAEREGEVLKQYAGDKYHGPDILLGAGNSELFTHDVLGLDKRDDEDG